MPDAPIDPRWPKLLSLSSHEFRTPMTVIAGYTRMLLKEQAGALTDRQRHQLQEVEKACGRLSTLVKELSELSRIEAGAAPLTTQSTDLHAAIRQGVAQLPPMPDREVAVELALEPDPAPMNGNPAQLAQAFGSIIAALRRELISEQPLSIRERRMPTTYELHAGDSETLAALDAEPPDSRAVFDEWRGGVGLSLPIARRIINQHGGQLYAPPEGRKAGARIVLPR